MSEKELTKDENELGNTVSQTPEEDAWLAGMEGKYPDMKGNREALFKASREGYDREHELNKENADAYGKIYNAIDKSPEVASFINKLTNPDDGAYPEEAFAELGEDLVKLLTGEIDNEAYRNAKKTRYDNEAAEKAKEEEKNAAIGEAFVNACKELNLDPEETEKKIIAKFNGEDATEFLANTEFFKAIINSLSYEDDMLAAEARGRNANMQERDKRKSMGSDGLPRGGQSGARPKKADPNSLEAMQMYRRKMNS